MIVPHGINFKLEYAGNTFPVILPHVVGMHYVGSALAAIAVANEAGCDLLTSITAISDYTTPPGRLSLIEGIRGTVLIDDTYNANPTSVEAALETLFGGGARAGETWVCLGDMLELGKLTEEAHREAGELAASIADILITVGPRSKSIADGALEKKFSTRKLKSFDTSAKASEFLQDFVEKGDVILLKGSQGVRLEKTVKALMAHPEDAPALLARQEKEWKMR